MSDFVVEVFQNEYLPIGGTEVHAIVSVAGPRGAARRPGASDGDVAVVVIIDTSGSMAADGRIHHARQAAAAAIETVRDGTFFAVLAGANRATPVYPPAGLAEASPTTRAQAIGALRFLSAAGGTAMGEWLIAAREALGAFDGARRAILLTDGKNESEPPARFAAALAACEGMFQCDCRGVGADWHVEDLRRIAGTLLGTLDIIPEASAMPDDFRSMMQSSMSQTVGTAALRVWTPASADIEFVRQVYPAVAELTGRCVRVDARTVDHATGAWGDERRDYHLCVRVPAHEMGREMLAARVAMQSGGEVSSPALVRAVWTDDRMLSTRLSPEVAHYTGQAEMAGAIQSGLAARRAGDLVTARADLGRAVRLATEAGNTAAVSRLTEIVDIVDARTGQVRLRLDVSTLDEMTADARSQRTERARPG